MTDTPFQLSKLADTPGAPDASRGVKRERDTRIRPIVLPRALRSFSVPSIGYFAHDDTRLIQVVARQEDEVHFKVRARGEDELTRATAKRLLAQGGTLIKTRLRLDGPQEQVWFDGEWRPVGSVCQL